MKLSDAGLMATILIFFALTSHAMIKENHTKIERFTDALKTAKEALERSHSSFSIALEKENNLLTDSESRKQYLKAFHEFLLAEENLNRSRLKNDEQTKDNFYISLFKTFLLEEALKNDSPLSIELIDQILDFQNKFLSTVHWPLELKDKAKKEGLRLIVSALKQSLEGRFQKKAFVLLIYAPVMMSF